jgi:uncharacterized protein (TIGR02466 family)|tara:strand:- start:83 stop:676 length:594 start_codon:yes stop_codon:yes gene_type:complete
MVNVKQHKVFPTIINEIQFDMDEQEHNLVIDELNDMEKFQEDNLIVQTTDDLSKHIPKFTKSIYKITEKICEKYEYLYDRLEFTGMWANKLKAGDIHPPHTHSNNIFSGVYYLEGGSQIQFFDPRPQASVLHPNLKYTNFDNSGMIGFDAEKGTGLIFPSWLQHWVTKTNKTRISISWNILLRGDYGQPGTLQNSHI